MGELEATVTLSASAWLAPRVLDVADLSRPFAPSDDRRNARQDAERALRVLDGL